MHGRDLHVLDVPASVFTLVLNAKVGKLDALIDDGEVVLPRPLLDLLAAPSRPTIAVRSIPIRLLQEPLILTLQLVIEDHTFKAGAVGAKAFSDAFKGAIQLRVM